MSADIAEIEGVDFFLRLIQHRFMREAKIIESFDTVLRQVPELGSRQQLVLSPVLRTAFSASSGARVGNYRKLLLAPDEFMQRLEDG